MKLTSLVFSIVLVSTSQIKCALGSNGKTPKREQCGQSIISDSGLLEYPGPLNGDNLYRGEVCVWTLHLNLTQNFSINFQKFDLRSTSPNFDCSDIGIRIYSLQNSKDAVNFT